MLNKKMQKLGEERSVIREIFEYGNQRAKQIGRENVYDFSLGNPSVPAPDGVRQEIERLLRELPSEKLHGYTSAAGAPEVRQAVSDYIAATFGVPMCPELIYMTCGAAASLTVTFHALAEAGDEFIVLTPYFPEYNVFIAQAGGKVVPVRTDSNFHIDISALAAAINEHTKAVLVNSPNNPTGAVYGEEELKALASLLGEKSKQYKKPIYVIADEPYRELTYGAKVPYIPALYPNTIVCYSFSKSLSLAGERIGYIAVAPACEGSEEIFSAVCGAGRSLGYVCAPALFQRVCAKLLGQSGDIRAYERNRDLLY
ncbi:MAG: pyridoxal phosphate-dependent aminotransferase, partial [Clostridia bacterium]|nr:pyridoxal phosphate-dependent aminotransferase [Clostridia bacterium]